MQEEQDYDNDDDDDDDADDDDDDDDNDDDFTCLEVFPPSNRQVRPQSPSPRLRHHRDHRDHKCDFFQDI